MPLLGLAGRQFIPCPGVSPGNIEIEGFHRTRSGVADFVVFATFNQKKRTSFDAIRSPIDVRFSSAGRDIEPLVGTFVPVVGPALVAARLDDHRCSLRTRVVGEDAKTLLKADHCLLHRGARFIWAFASLEVTYS